MFITLIHLISPWSSTFSLFNRFSHQSLTFYLPMSCIHGPAILILNFSQIASEPNKYFSRYLPFEYSILLFPYWSWPISNIKQVRRIWHISRWGVVPCLRLFCCSVLYSFIRCESCLIRKQYFSKKKVIVFGHTSNQIKKINLCVRLNSLLKLLKLQYFP